MKSDMEKKLQRFYKRQAKRASLPAETDLRAMQMMAPVRTRIRKTAHVLGKAAVFGVSFIFILSAILVVPSLLRVPKPPVETGTSQTTETPDSTTAESETVPPVVEPTYPETLTVSIYNCDPNGGISYLPLALDETRTILYNGQFISYFDAEEGCNANITINVEGENYAVLMLTEEGELSFSSQPVDCGGGKILHDSVMTWKFFQKYNFAGHNAIGVALSRGFLTTQEANFATLYLWSFTEQFDPEQNRDVTVIHERLKLTFTGIATTQDGSKQLAYEPHNHCLGHSFAVTLQTCSLEEWNDVLEQHREKHPFS